MRHLSYLVVLAACLVCVAPLAVTVRHSLLVDVPRLVLSLAVPFGLFTGWDLYAINAHQWGYARARTVGMLFPGRLPVEEGLFFLVIPLCIILTFETVQRVLRPAPESTPTPDSA